jgi:tRNA threonylcarbamoyladenosine biosynthesis protein TsaB
MLIVTIRTDKPEAELGLFDGDKELAYVSWQAHRQLAETIHTQLETMLAGQRKQLQEIEAVCVYKGPGSFTGLRIGASVANALADALTAPIVGESEEDWLQRGLQRLKAGDSDKVVVPLYGSAPHITAQKK